jgi:hypothetical protein
MSIDFTHFKDANDIRMMEASRGFRLGTEAEQVLWSGNGSSKNHLDGDRPVKVGLIGFEDDPHAAASEFGDEFVLAEATPDPSRI